LGVFHDIVQLGASTRERSLNRRATMKKDGDRIELTTQEASGGVTQHGVRYVLAVSLLFAILALSAIWILGSTQK
jgi:cobalamin biosynthesis Mg chelatase CobN